MSQDVHTTTNRLKIKHGNGLDWGKCIGHGHSVDLSMPRSTIDLSTLVNFDGVAKTATMVSNVERLLGQTKRTRPVAPKHK